MFRSFNQAPKDSPNPSKTVAIIQHTAHEHPALIGRALLSQGIPFRVIHVYRHEPLPNPHDLTGLISLGGPMGANDEDEHPWIAPEIHLLRDCVHQGLPVVGICLGGQMLAKSLGGRVERHSTKELGWLPIQLNPKGKDDPIFGAAGDDPVVYHWHGDTFFLPADAELFACSTACARQGYKIGSHVYGLQFHPEADHALVAEWLNSEGAAVEVASSLKTYGLSTIQDPETQLRNASIYEGLSAPIATAIASLFRSRPNHSKVTGMRNRLSSFSSKGSPTLITLPDKSENQFQLEGKILRFFSIQFGEFILLKESCSELLWPIQIEDILCAKSVE